MRVVDRGPTLVNLGYLVFAIILSHGERRRSDRYRGLYSSIGTIYILSPMSPDLAEDVCCYKGYNIL